MSGAKIAQIAMLMRAHMARFDVGERIPGVHTFGIKNGDLLAMATVADCKEIAGQAGLKPSLGTELYEGIKLARYVMVRD